MSDMLHQRVPREIECGETHDDGHLACHEAHLNTERDLASCREIANNLRAALTAAQERERVMREALELAKRAIDPSRITTLAAIETALTPKGESR